MSEIQLPPEFVMLIALLDTTYQRPADEARIMSYFNALNDIELPLIKQAIDSIITTDEYYPTPATIRKRILSANTKMITADESINLVNKLISLYGFHRYSEGLEWLKQQDEMTYNVVKKIGYRTLCMTNSSVWLNLYNKIYREVSKAETMECLLPNNLQLEVDKVRRLSLN